jgi:hypothetical protein
VTTVAPDRVMSGSSSGNSASPAVVSDNSGTAVVSGSSSGNRGTAVVSGSSSGNSGSPAVLSGSSDRAVTEQRRRTEIVPWPTF